MMKKLLSIIIAVAVFLCLPAVAARAVEHYPTELTYYDKTNAYAGVTLFTPLRWPVAADGFTLSQTAYTYLIDMYGTVVHKWPCPKYAPWTAQLLENGNLLRAVTPPPPRVQVFNPVTGSYVWQPQYLNLEAGAACGLMEEVDWNEKIVNSWNVFSSYNGRMFRLHHDMKRIHNKALNADTTLFIAWENFNASEAPSGATSASYGFSLCAIYEVDSSHPANDKTGANILWKWSFYDHLTTGNDPSKLNVALDANQSQDGPRLRPDWNHIDSLDYNPDLG